MKRIVFLIMMAAGLIALAACEEITNQEEQGVVSMTSFGFYMQDNPDLYSDVVIENITSNAITVRFPMVTPESAISSLIPRFEVTEGATVLNGNTQVISGETAVDFSSPVDLVVSLGSSNAMYTITVLINQPLKWEMLAQSEIAMADGPVMAISQTDGIPYLFGSIDAEESDFEYPNLLALSGSTLESVAGNLIQARDAEHYHFDNKDLQDAFTLAELAYKDEMNKVYAYLKDNKVGSDVAAMAGVFADHAPLIEPGLEMDKDAAGCGAK